MELNKAETFALCVAEEGYVWIELADPRAAQEIVSVRDLKSLIKDSEDYKGEQEIA